MTMGAPSADVPEFPGLTLSENVQVAMGAVSGIMGLVQFFVIHKPIAPHRDVGNPFLNVFRQRLAGCKETFNLLLSFSIPSLRHVSTHIPLPTQDPLKQISISGKFLCPQGFRFRIQIAALHRIPTVRTCETISIRIIADHTGQPLAVSHVPRDPVAVMSIQKGGIEQYPGVSLIDVNAMIILPFPCRYYECFIVRRNICRNAVLGHVVNQF